VGEFITGEAARERFRVLHDQVDDAYAQMRQLSSDEVGNEFRVEMAERLEHQERTNRGLMYRMFAQIADPPDEVGLVGAVIDSLWARLRIPRTEIKRRMKVGARIRERRQLTGPPLPPQLSLVAAAVEAGTIGEDHLRAITGAVDRLPSCVSADDRVEVEASLVREAAKNDADIVTKAGRRIDEIFNPDGDFDEQDRARRRGLLLGRQGRDGMSRLDGYIDPETRASLEALTAAVRPGRHLPDGAIAETADQRSVAQRRHDALKLGLKAAIASGGLGSHRGHPVTVIARTTLAELEQAAHAVTNPAVPMPPPARTGGTGVLPMRDLIRMAGQGAIHYLAVFDGHTERPLYLGRQTRIATADQRIICYLRDGGCTRPGCLTAGYDCEVHHSPHWSPDGRTDADCLFFACPPDHKLITDGHYRTSITDGRLAWTNGTTPPEVNHAHHPEELLRGNTDPPENDKE
jgi:uncharacterized protein DUF222